MPRSLVLAETEGFWVDCLPDKETHTKVLHDKVEKVPFQGVWHLPGQIGILGTAVDCFPTRRFTPRYSMNKVEMVPTKESGTCQVREGFWVDCLPDKDTCTIS